METIKTTKTEEKLLSSLDLKCVDLDTKNSNLEFLDGDMLNEEIEEFLRYILTERDKKITNEEFKEMDFKLYYSLSCCQGDGVSFETNSFNGDVALKLSRRNKNEFKFLKDFESSFKANKTSSHYEHKNTFDVYGELEGYTGEKDEDKVDFEKADNLIDELSNAVDDYFKDLCDEIEKYGYAVIENYEKKSICKIGLRDWLIENNINEDLYFFDVDYIVRELNCFGNPTKKEDLKGYIKVCNSGDTSIELWIKDQKLKIENKIKAKAEITEYEEKTLI